MLDYILSPSAYIVCGLDEQPNRVKIWWRVDRFFSVFSIILSILYPMSFAFSPASSGMFFLVLDSLKVLKFYVSRWLSFSL